MGHVKRLINVKHKLSLCIELGSGLFSVPLRAETGPFLFVPIEGGAYLLKREKH